MLDLRLRSLKDRTLGPLAQRLSGRVAPLALSIAGAVLCVGAGILAWQSFAIVATACWLTGRLLDGLDGLVARDGRRTSDLGGYADLLLDSIGYAAVPVGIAAGAGDLRTWALTATLIATFYVNAVSLLMLSAILEKRSAGATRRGESTTVTMPPALVEGFETIIAFAIALARPAWADTVFVVMSIAVVIGIVQRSLAARRLLGTV